MWIESHQSLLTHRKTIRFAKSLGVKKVTAIGHLHAMWWWCVDNAATGFIATQDFDGLCEGSLWEDESDAFIQAVVASGFGDWATDGLDIHDWPDYAGKLLERRALDRERMRDYRANSRGTFTERSPDVRITKDERSSDVLSTVPDLTGPNRTQQNKTLPEKQPSAAVLAAGSAADLFGEFAARIESGGANAGAVLAEAVSSLYSIECRDYGRLGKLAKEYTPTAVLDRVFGLSATWSGKGNPVNYITAAMNGHASDRKNGNGHSGEKLPTNHQPKDLPATVADNRSLAEIHAEVDGSGSEALTGYRAWRDQSRLAKQQQTRPTDLEALPHGSEPPEFAG